MMNDKTFGLVLDQTAVAFLAFCLQSPSFLGLEDPFWGLLAEEIEEQLENAGQTLADQGYLEVQPDGSLILDAGVAALIEASASANRTLIASRTDSDGTSHFRFIHLTADLIVEQETLPDDQVALTAVRDLETLEQRLTDFLNLSEASAVPGPLLTLTEADITEARRLALEEGEETCRAFLDCAGVPAEAVEALAAALAEGSGPGSLTVLHREAREMHYGEILAWLAGPRGAWRIQPLTQQEPVTVRLIPAATTEIQQRITRLAEAAYQEVRR